MSILSALVRAYDRLPAADRPAFGYSVEKIGFVISLHPDGEVAGFTDLRDGEGKKKLPRPMLVPSSFKRPGTAPRPFFLWDNANYALGLGQLDNILDQRYNVFREKHISTLSGSEDEGVRAFVAFLQKWKPEHIDRFGDLENFKQSNFAFEYAPDNHRILLHQRPDPQKIWAGGYNEWVSVEGKNVSESICLVTGLRSPTARTHPAIRGIRPTGGKEADSIVSFNAPAYESYGHVQGDNAPVSEAAAFAYTTVLNRFLARDSGHRIQIGDASVVYWADSADAEKSAVAESIFAAMVEPGAEDEHDARRIGDLLRRMRRGERLKHIDPGLAEGVRFHVLGLSPNAARLSVRYWFEDDFGVLAENYAHWIRDTAFEPWPKDLPAPSIRGCELRTAPAMRDAAGRVRFDTDRISPLLAGELLRAVLTGARFPAALLSLLLMRVRGDGHLDATRAALIKAIVARAMRLDRRLPKNPDGTPEEDYLMRSDPDDPNPARRLGRLFAVIERAQLAALGDGVNATVADKFLGAASAAPGRVMTNLIRNARDHHLKRLRNGHADTKWIKDATHARAVAAALDRDIGRLVAGFGNGFPAQLNTEEQGLFLIGYYQERYGPKGDAATDDANDEPHQTVEE